MSNQYENNSGSIHQKKELSDLLNLKGFGEDDVIFTNDGLKDDYIHFKDAEEMRAFLDSGNTYHTVYSQNNVLRFKGYGALIYKMSVGGTDLGVIARDNFHYEGYYNPCDGEKKFKTYEIF